MLARRKMPVGHLLEFESGLSGHNQGRHRGSYRVNEGKYMAIGLGILLLVLGLILALDVVTVDLDFINDSALGTILIIAGILAIVLSLVVNAQRSRRTTVVDDRRLPTEPQP